MTKETRCLYLIPVVLAEGTQDSVITPQVKEVVASLDVFLVENVRSARRFISSLKLGKVIDDILFIDLNKDTPFVQTRKDLMAVAPGKDMGVLSEAGCPGIADPGAIAAKLAHQLGIKVVPLAGPSSILLALMASGFNGQSFTFHGYLPIDKHERRKSLLLLERTALLSNQSQIFMETPFRNQQILETILDTLRPDTLLCIACNITAPDEFISTQSVSNWRKHKPDLHKKPCIFIIG